MILVTGGAGYIGAVLVRELLARDYRVRVFDKLYFGSKPLEEIMDRIELVQGDVREFDDGALDGVEAVIHLGSLSNDPTADFNPEANHQINCVGTLKVAEACRRRGVRRFTLASTAAVYGFHVDSIADEEFPPNPQSVYAQSKLDAERGLLELAGPDFAPAILRQGTVYGYSPRMRWDLVVNTFCRDAFTRGALTVLCGGEMWRPLVDIHDVAAAHIACIEAPEETVGGQVFNLVHKNFRILELAHWVKQVLEPRRDLGLQVNYDSREPRSYRISHEKIERVLGFRAETTVDQAVGEIMAALDRGECTDVANPIYYNIEWMKLLVEMESRLKTMGRVL